MTHEERKQRPVFTGLLKYFPDACMEVAYVSYKANEQHNPGEPMYWNKEKSIGTGDEIVRHLMATEKYDTDGLRHLGKVAWRALELLQREIDMETKKPEEPKEDDLSECCGAIVQNGRCTDCKEMDRA